MRKAMTRARLLTAAAALSLAGCSGQERTGATEASQQVPDVATPVPAVTADPDFIRREVSFEGNDTDGDGRVTPSEFAAASQRFFAAVDTDDDGTVSLEEMEAAGAAMKVSDRSRARKTIAAADNDGDGELTLAEFIGFVNARFTRIDRNGDGSLSPAEFNDRFTEIRAAAAQATPAAGATGIAPAGQ
jgi:Ca2+-binding EF-hand superfamily protein